MDEDHARTDRVGRRATPKHSIQEQRSTNPLPLDSLVDRESCDQECRDEVAVGLTPPNAHHAGLALDATGSKREVANHLLVSVRRDDIGSCGFGTLCLPGNRGQPAIECLIAAGKPFEAMGIPERLRSTKCGCHSPEKTLGVRTRRSSSAITRGGSSSICCNSAQAGRGRLNCVRSASNI